MSTLSKYFVALCIAIVLSACSSKTDIQLSAGDPKLATQVGTREGSVIKSNGVPGFLVYGPYQPLEKGVYRLVSKGDLSGPTSPVGIIDVAVNKGALVIAEKSIVTGGSGSLEIASIEFELKQPVNDIEFRIRVGEGTKGSFTGYELKNIERLSN